MGRHQFCHKDHSENTGDIKYFVHKFKKPPKQNFNILLLSVHCPSKIFLEIYTKNPQISGLQVYQKRIKNIWK